MKTKDKQELLSKSSEKLEKILKELNVASANNHLLLSINKKLARQNRELKKVKNQKELRKMVARIKGELNRRGRQIK